MNQDEELTKMCQKYDKLTEEIEKLHEKLEKKLEECRILDKDIDNLCIKINREQ